MWMLVLDAACGHHLLGIAGKSSFFLNCGRLWRCIVDWHGNVRAYCPDDLAVLGILMYDPGLNEGGHANETATGDFLYLFMWYVRAGPERSLQRQGRQRQSHSKCRHVCFAGPRV